MPYISYDRFFEIASDGGFAGNFHLTDETALLCIILLATLNYDVVFQNDDDSAISPAQSALLYSMIAQGVYEIMEATLVAGLPVGFVLPYAGDVADIPSNALLCDGTTYDRVDYPALYAILDSAFILDADTFFVPDMVGRTVVGTETAQNAAGGQSEVTLTTAEMPSHHHDRNASGVNEYPILGTPEPPFPLSRTSYTYDATGSPIYSIVYGGDTGGGDPHDNMPPYRELYYVIIASEA